MIKMRDRRNAMQIAHNEGTGNSRRLRSRLIGNAGGFFLSAGLPTELSM